MPPKIQWYPKETKVGPAFYVDDDSTTVLGKSTSTGKPGLVVKEFARNTTSIKVDFVPNECKLYLFQ